MDPLIILAIGIATAMVVVILTDRSVQRKVRKLSAKPTLSRCIPPPPVVHFGAAPVTQRSPSHYPSNSEVNDWGERGDVVKLRNSEPKIPTGGDAA